MSYISTGVEYALHCLLFLVAPPDAKGSPSGARVEANVRDLAALQGVPVDYLAKLFSRLSRAGLVVATEGAGGGFALARPAEEISFLDVVVAIDGEKPLFECREIRDRCAVFDSRPPAWATSGVCSIHAVMLAAEERMKEELASQSLAKLAHQMSIKAPASFGLQIANWMKNRKSNSTRSTP